MSNALPIDPTAPLPAPRLSDDAFPRARIRERDLEALAARLRRNDCCHVLGASNSGKSSLLRSLETTEVRAHLATDGGAEPVVGFVDCLDLNPRSDLMLPSHQYWPKQLALLVEAMEASGYQGRVLELLTEASAELGRSHPPASGPLVDVREFWPKVMQATMVGMTDAGLSSETCERFAEAHAAVASADLPVERESLAESALRALLAERDPSGRRRTLILVLDEFDDAFELAGPSTWRTLRRMRDAFDRDGLRFALVVATCRELDAHRVVAQGADIDPAHEFRELFHHDPLVLGALADNEARRLLAFVGAERGLGLTEAGRAQAIFFAGGHAGLLCHLAEVLARSAAEAPDSEADDETLRSLLRLQRIRTECARLWNELGRGCNIALTLWHKGTLPEHDPSGEHLKRQGILAADGAALRSPLFEAYVRMRYVQNLDTERRGIYYDTEDDLFYLDHEPMVLADRLQSVLSALYDAPGEWLSARRILKQVWGEHSSTENIVQQYLRKLRDVLGEDADTPRFVFNKAGHGYQLVRTGDRRPPDATTSATSRRRRPPTQATGRPSADPSA